MQTQNPPYGTDELLAVQYGEKNAPDQPPAADVAPYTLLAAGIDTLQISFFADMITSEADFSELAFRKELLRADEAASNRITMGSERFQLQPYGRHPYTYLLVSDAFEIGLAERMQPSVTVRFNCKALWRCGWPALVERLQAWLASLNAIQLRYEKIARADFAFDFYTPQVDFGCENFTSRATADSTFRKHKNVQTFAFGKGDVVVRIYDKAAEIREASNKYWFYDVWGRKTDVWRVEFQVRGPRLKLGGIQTVDQLSLLQYDLLYNLAVNHTVLRKISAGRNKSRWPRHPLWKSLTKAIKDKPRTGLVRHIAPTSGLSYRQANHARMLYGHLPGLAALHQLLCEAPEPLTLEEVSALLPKWLDPYHSPTLWREKIKAKLSAHEADQW